MNKLEYKVTFNTPAFLGNAEQQGQWRVPPFKALLRQWWRVVHAPVVSYEWRRLREDEGRLFGHVHLNRMDPGQPTNTWASRSRLTLRLSNWQEGDLDLREGEWPDTKFHPVRTTKDGKGHVRADVYMAYGSITPPSRKQGLPNVTFAHPPAIKQGNARQLTVLWRGADSEMKEIRSALGLAHCLGTVGSRSHNGWGSLALEQEGLPSPHDMQTWYESLRPVARPWTECLGLDWPHAIGTTPGSKPLVWYTETGDWAQIMQHLAEVKVAARFAAKDYPRGPEITGVFLLGYPAGGAHTAHALDKTARWAGQVRFKVARLGTQLRGVIAHLPTGVPEPLARSLEPGQLIWLEENQEEIWKQVHSALDAHKDLTRLDVGERP